MNEKKAPPQGRGKGRKHAWPRRALLVALIAAAVLAVRGLPETEAPKTPAAPSETPAPTSNASERAAREAAYDKDVAALTALVDSAAADDETRAQAARQLERLISDHQSELGLEEALAQAGFAPCLVLMQNGSLTVIVSSQEITGEQSAAILALCTAHTDVEAENIRIMTRQAL